MFVLVHSPSVGLSSWEAVAQELQRDGHKVVVPSLREVALHPPPSAPLAVRCVRDALAGVDQDQPLTLVVHSNAGFFAPCIALGAGHPVGCVVFVDAGMPPREGESPLATPELFAFLEERAVNGLLPPWTRWWDEDEVRALFPDEAAMRRFQADEPRLPLTYYAQSVPAPAGWDERRCGYLLYSEAYDPCADDARARGWPVETLRGEHLHMLLDPAGTARAVVRLAGAAAAQ